MNILGLDPAAACGFAVSREVFGVWQIVHTTDKHPGRRLERLRKRIYETHREYRLDAIAMENAAMGANNFNTAAMHNELRGVVKLTAAELELPVILVNPTTLKKWLTGHGRAKKPDMIDAVRRQFGLAVTDHNIADAIAVMEFARSQFSNQEVRCG